MTSAPHDTPWEKIPVKTRNRMVWGIWFITWLWLLAGMLERVFWEYVVLFSATHALQILLLFIFRISAFPVQVRLAYFAWVAIGTYVPFMEILMYITILGLASNLFLGYCPLARMLYLLPWNTEEPFSVDLLKRVFLSPPVAGKFTPPPPS